MKKIHKRRKEMWLKYSKSEKDMNRKVENRKEDAQQWSTVVTDHAIVRYLERTGIVDVRAIAKEIEHIIIPSSVLGDGIYYKNGLGIIVKDGKAVTTITKDMAV